jgi:hypothetical protein
MVPNLVEWYGRLWFCKPRGRWPEILAYLLGGSWLNVAEVIPGSDAGGVMTLEGDTVSIGPEPLIRIGQDCTENDLIVKDLDAAMADAVERIRDFSDMDLRVAAYQAGASDPDGVAQLLMVTRDELPNPVGRLREILYQS